jgi:site-specific recombinase XerD
MKTKTTPTPTRTLIRDSWPFVRFVRSSGRYQVDTRTTGGGGGRKLYDTQEQALEAARIASEQKREFGAASYRNDELAAFGWTVPQAIAFVIEHLRKTMASCPIAGAVAALLKLRAQENCSARYLESLRYELARFAKTFDGKTMADIKASDIANYLSDAATAGARNTRRKHLVTLFSFGVKEKWTSENPAKEIGRLKEKFDVQTLTPEQMTRLLASCDALPEPAAGAMRAYIALAGFAGIRPEELHRLDWKDVNLSEGSAFIGADVSKVAEARAVPLSENCKAWLATSSTRTGLVAPKAGFRYRFDMVRSAAGYAVRGQGGEKWQSDVLRHSFASYWLKIHNNRAALAEHMGNSAKIIGKHYKRVVPLDEAEAWFAILPVDAETKILRMG